MSKGGAVHGNGSAGGAWGHDVLNRPGIGDSLYTPFAGPDGDDIDLDAYRTLVRHCVGSLRHELLWLTSGIGEFW
jgi:hypothetical protein